MSFSPDEKTLAVVLNQPDTKVLIYRWSVASTSGTGKVSKLITWCEFPKLELTKITFHPADRTVVLVSGNGLLKQFFINEDTLAPSEFDYQGLPRPMSDIYFSDHIWTEEN